MIELLMRVVELVERGGNIFLNQGVGRRELLRGRRRVVKVKQHEQKALCQQFVYVLTRIALCDRAQG